LTGVLGIDPMFDPADPRHDDPSQNGAHGCQTQSAEADGDSDRGHQSNPRRRGQAFDLSLLLQF
jgi:hypothetical protein